MIEPNNVEVQNMQKSCGISSVIAKYYIKKHKSCYYAEREFKNDAKIIGQILNTFQKYIEDENQIFGQKFDRLFTDMTIQNDHYMQLYFTKKCRAQRVLRFTQDEFLSGMLKLRCSSIADFRKILQNIKAKLTKPKKLKSLYIYFFSVFSEGKINISFTAALGMWDALLSGRFPTSNIFIEFCNSLTQDFRSQSRVSLDVWVQVWRFNEEIGYNLQLFNEDDAWPILICDFVDFLKQKQN